jgi:NAD(P)-dependent dehydrogenase (short-subunit alcohol dehydrogenase family)
LLISKGTLNRDCLKGQTAIITGAGRGIGYEAARALAWLGANIVIAEINVQNAKLAEQMLQKEFDSEKIISIHADISKEDDIQTLKRTANKKFGKVDIILNNATVFPMGPVTDTTIERWDFSYQVNLRGPVMLARAFLPDMLRRKNGVFVCVSSSGAAPYMGAYEVFKTAQGELANTIAGEIEDSGVYAFTIGPGIVKTPGFIEGGSQAAAFMGKTLDQLLEMNKNFEITPEAAGAGFAAAIAQANKYHGQETSSIQALKSIGIELSLSEEKETQTTQIADKNVQMAAFEPVIKTYKEQSEGWKSRNVFQRQWIYRDFRKETNMSIEEMLAQLESLGDNIEMGKPTARFKDALNKLHDYYVHQQEMLKGFEKISKRQEEGQAIIEGWKKDINTLISVI